MKKITLFIIYTFISKLMMKTREDKEKFFTLFESEIQFQKFLLEILPHIGFSNIVYNHGNGELGKDIIAETISEIGIVDVYSFVIKMELKSTPGIVKNIIGQIEQSFESPYIDNISNKHQISKVIVVAVNKLTKNFQIEINQNIRFAQFQANTFVWDKFNLIELINDKYPEYWEKARISVLNIKSQIDNILLKCIHEKGWKEIYDTKLDNTELVKIYSYICTHLKNSDNSLLKVEIMQYLEKYDLVKATELLLKDIHNLEEDRLRNNRLSSDRLFELGKIYTIQGEYDKALKVYNESINYDPNNTDALNDFGLLLSFTDDYEESNKKLNEAYKIDFLENESKESEKSIKRRLDYCRNLLKVGSIKELEEVVNYCSEQSIDILDESHYLFSIINNFKGQIARYKGEYEDGLRYSLAALNIAKAANDNRETYISMSNVGQMYLEKGMSGDKNSELIMKALQNFSESHILALEVEKEDFDLKDVILSNIGVTYYALGDYEKSIEFYERSLAIQKKRFGDVHHKIANRYNNLANSYAYLGDLEIAKEFLNKSLSINREIYGENHEEVAKNYVNLGRILCMLEELNEGKEFLIKTSKILEFLEIHEGSIHASLENTLKKFKINL